MITHLSVYSCSCLSHLISLFLFHTFSNIRITRSLCAVKLSLNDCDFAGPLPTELGYLWNMTRLQMKNNAFTGTIPQQYGRLEELEQFTIEGNKLTGEVPLEVCDLLKEKLDQFVVDCYNRRSGIGFECEPQCCTLCRDVS